MSQLTAIGKHKVIVWQPAQWAHTEADRDRMTGRSDLLTTNYALWLIAESRLGKTFLMAPVFRSRNCMR